MKLILFTLFITLSTAAFANYQNVDFKCATEISLETYSGIKRLAYGRTDIDIIAEEGRNLDGLAHFLRPIKTIQKNEHFNRHLTDFKIFTRVKDSKQKFKFNFIFSKKDLSALLSELNIERASEVKSGARIAVNVENITQIPELEAGYHGRDMVRLKNSENGDRLIMNVSCYLVLWGYGQYLDNVQGL